MAQLVLGAVGAVVGTFIPGVGPYIGWTIGSAIGGLIDPPKGPTVEGPKLTDLKTQTSDYGTVLPVVYGTVRMAGNVIWADEVKEKRNKEKAGKGGGGGQTTITYTYSVSFAVGLCEGVIEGIRRIWANGDLIYSAAETSNAGTIEESGKIAARFRVYKGTEDQQVDPTCEAVFGDDAIPYRGVAHVVFTDLQLEQFGNRLPNLEFEVVKAGETVPYRTLWSNTQDAIVPLEEWKDMEPQLTGFSGLPTKPGPKLVSANGSLYRLSSPVKLQNGAIGNLIQDAAGRVFDINAASTSLEAFPVTESTQDNTDRPGVFQENSKELDGVPYDMGSICRLGSDFVDLFVRRSVNSSQTLDHKLGDRGKLMYGGHFMHGPGLDFDDYRHGRTDLSSVFPAGMRDLYFMGAHGSGDNSRMIVFAGPDDYSFVRTGTRLATHWVMIELVGGIPRATKSGTLDQPRDSLADLGGLGLPLGLSEVGVSRHLYFMSGCLDTDGVSFWCNVRATDSGTTLDGSSSVGLYQIDPDGVMRFKYRTPNPSPGEGTVSSGGNKTIYAANGNSFAFYRSMGESEEWDNLSILATHNPAVSKQSIPLSHVVEDQLTRVGFEPHEFDTSELTDMVDGFFLANRPSVRTAIETLTGPYLFDVVESDTVLKFVKRGKQPVRTLHFEELGATDGDPTDRPDPLLITRQQELSQPLEISAQYQDRDADYRIGVQYARRQLTQAVNQVSIQLPLVLSGTKAKQVVDAVLFNSWMEREKFEFKTDRRHLELEPTDIVNLVSPNGNTFTARIVSRAEGGDGTIKWEAVGDEAAVYQPIAEGVIIPPTTGEQVDGLVPTWQLVFNAPPLTNAIDSPGFYVAATGYSATGWSGSIAMRSLDGGQDYQYLQQSVVERGDSGTMGTAINALGDWKGGNTLDTTNSLIVNCVGGGELAGASYDAVLSGANALWVGGEVIQFQDAEQLSATQYKLSRLRRGRLGTERFIGSHRPGESWVLLDPSDIQFQPEALGNAGQPQLVRGVTLGTQDPSGVPASSFTFDATTVRPLSPAHAFGIAQPGGRVDFRWVRRSRIDGEWIDGVDVPLDEPSEVYELEIATDSNFSSVVRTQELTSPSYVYTAADRALDTGSTSSPIFARVYQMSSRAGRGFPATVEINE